MGIGEKDDGIPYVEPQILIGFNSTADGRTRIDIYRILDMTGAPVQHIHKDGFLFVEQPYKGSEGQLSSDNSIRDLASEIRKITKK